MKTALILFAAAIPAFAQQSFDFKLLDKLAANAKDSTNITLDGDTLKMASGLLSGADDSIKSLAKNLQSVYIREFEYERAGQYDPADLAPLRAYLNTTQWKKIVDVKDGKEDSQIYVQPMQDDKLGGLAILSVEPKEVSIVLIEGQLNLSDIGKITTHMGLPSAILDHGGKKSDDSKKE